MFSRVFTAIAFSALPSLALAAPVSVEGRTIEFPGAVGYCDLDMTVAGDKSLYDLQAQVQAGKNHIIAYQGACNELIAFRVGANEYLQEYMIAMVPLTGGVFQPATMTRADFIALMQQQLPAVDPNVVSQIETQGSGITVEGAQMIGVLGQDENAIYFGMLLDVSNATTRLTGAAVVAMTLIGDVPMSLNFYRPYKSLSDVDALATEAALAMQALVQANP